ncbi:hypothetical protein DICVIV_13574, partial [Dictyocaulus viviparus]
KTINFNLTGFDLPAAMVYSPEVTAPSVAPTISTTETAAASLVRVLVDGSLMFMKVYICINKNVVQRGGQ